MTMKSSTMPFYRGREIGEADAIGQDMAPPPATLAEHSAVATLGPENQGKAGKSPFTTAPSGPVVEI